MSKPVISLWGMLIGVLAAPSFAASLSMTKAQANNTFQVYLNSESTVFDTFAVRISSTADFIRYDYAFQALFPRGPGEPFTFINQYLGANPANGGEGLTILGAQVTGEKIQFDATRLGGVIDTSGHSDGNLFLANVMLDQPAPVVAEVRLIRAGQEIESLRFAFVPEPAAASLLAVGLLMLARNRPINLNLK